jgi:3-oxoadipate enol-lactonase
MDFIEVNGVGLRYELAGSGTKTLVLVHEMGGSLDSWDQVLPTLAAGRRVLRYDTRGAGQSEKVRGVLALDTMVDDLAALLDAVGIDGPVALAGCAVGAAITIRFASRFPNRAAALIITSPATGLAGERRAAGLQRADTVERDGMRAVVEASLAASYPPVLRADEARYCSFRARWLGNDPGSFAAINRMIANAEMEGDFAKIRCPTLVIAGTHDGLRPPEAVEAIARAIPGARYRVLETGHFMAVQTPQPVADAYAAFSPRSGTEAAASKDCRGGACGCRLITRHSTRSKPGASRANPIGKQALERRWFTRAKSN